jgi:mannose/fructose/N-acetylgalactosamine-specific phosphotransferase system component IIC
MTRSLSAFERGVLALFGVLNLLVGVGFAAVITILQGPTLSGWPALAVGFVALGVLAVASAGVAVAQARGRIETVGSTEVRE